MRFTALTCAALLALSVTRAEAGPALVFDPATGAVLGEDRAGEPWYPASLTKLMTAYIVFVKLKDGALTLDQALPVSAHAAKQEPSKLGVPEGKTVSVDMALQALLVYSANDMAIVLAEGARGSVANFVRDMNATARRLGMSATHFANPNGLYDERQVTTARDMGILAAALLRDFPERAHYFSQDFVKVGKRRLSNRNALLRQWEEADGMKTGFICNSGFNLVASATENGRKLVSVVFGARNSQERVNSAEALLKAGFAAPPAGSGRRLADIENVTPGSLVPADMTPFVCKGKDAIHWARGATLSGWGVTFGQYESADLANRALRGRVLGVAPLIDAGSTGVVIIPGLSGYAPMIWDLDQASALNVCATYRQEQVPCDVMPPDALQRIAALSVEKEAQAAAQGSEAAPKKKGRKTWSSAKKKKSKKK